MSDVINSAYFEANLRPRVPEIPDQYQRNKVTDLLNFVSNVEKEKKKKEEEAKKTVDQAPTSTSGPRPGDLEMELDSIKDGIDLNLIGQTAGNEIKDMVAQLIHYADELVSTGSN